MELDSLLGYCRLSLGETENEIYKEGTHWTPLANYKQIHAEIVGLRETRSRLWRRIRHAANG